MQLQSALAGNKDSGVSPVDQNVLDLHQAFVDVHAAGIHVRIGRQELSYGSQRLVATREWPNNRQSFDGVKVGLFSPNVKTNVFYTQHVYAQPGIFDDDVDDRAKFWGAYMVATAKKFSSFDFYYLGLAKVEVKFDDALGKELRHSIGTRIWGNKNGWRYDFEGLYQFGDVSDKRIRAWTLSSNAGYQFTSSRFAPEIGLKTEVISGDETAGDEVLGTFNPLYPRGAYFGLAALIGPANLADIHPSLSLTFTPAFELNIDYDVFWRYSTQDGIYAVNNELLYSGSGSAARFIGRQFATDVTYTPSKFILVKFELTYFAAGPYLKDVSSGKDIYFGGLTTQFKF